MEWKKVESMTEPSEYDFTSSKKYNYIHKNIETVEREHDGETYTVYVYDEAKVNKDDWQLYLDLTQAQADIDYLNMITEDL